MAETPTQERSRRVKRIGIARRYEWAGTRAELGLPSPGRGTPRPRRGRSRSRTPPKTRRSKWDMRRLRVAQPVAGRPDPTDPEQKPNVPRMETNKKRRECYLGNLPQHQAGVVCCRGR